MNLSNLFGLKEELFNQIYLYYEGLDGKAYIYNDTDERLSQTTINNIIENLYKCTELHGTINNISGKLTEDDRILDILCEYYERIEVCERQFEDMSYYEEVYELAHFDSSEIAIQILQDQYSAEAYDEHLEDYIQKSMVIAHERFKDLCEKSKDTLESMIKTIDNYLNTSKKLLNEFEKLEVRKINDKIDNT